MHLPDPTGMLYVLISQDCHADEVLVDYHSLAPTIFYAGNGVERSVNVQELLESLRNDSFPSGMARLSNGFIYILDDHERVIGFDGNMVKEEVLIRLGKDPRIQALLFFGDQPPPRTRREFLESCR